MEKVDDHTEPITEEEWMDALLASASDDEVEGDFESKNPEGNPEDDLPY